MKRCYCLLERFNNYFNRKIIRFDSLSDYQFASKDSFIPVNTDGSMSHFDFNPNDNVTAEIIVNNVPFDPDYFLLLDDDANIVQRWFVMEQRRNRQGQWLYTLRRDVVADNLGNLEEAPVFVEKAMLKEDDPFIVNSEGMSLNQIKKSETLLKDKSNTAWIVGYMARNIGGQDINIQVPAENINIPFKTLSEIAGEMGITESQLIDRINFDNSGTIKTYFATSLDLAFNVFTDEPGPIDQYFHLSGGFDSSFVKENIGVSNDPFVVPTLFDYSDHLSFAQATTIVNRFCEAVYDQRSVWIANLGQIFDRTYYLSNSQLEKLKAFNGFYVKYNGQYYQLNIQETATGINHKENIPSSNPCVSATANDTITLCQQDDIVLSISNNGVLSRVQMSEKETVITMQLVAESALVPQLTAKISSSRTITGDQEYDIFAIPLNGKIHEYGIWNTIEEYSRKMAAAIALEADAKVYDLQLLPYCPIPSIVGSSGEIDIANLTEGVDYDKIKGAGISPATPVAQPFTAAGFTFNAVDVEVYEATGSVYLSALPVGKTPIIDFIDFDRIVSGNIEVISYTVNGNTVDLTLKYITDSVPDASSFEGNVNYRWWTSDVACGLIFYVPKATFTTIIEKEISVDESKKVVSNCYMWRLVSPNYQGSFEFNIAKNGGKVSSFNVFCTYKPYAPVIKVAPNFDWLYGTEYQDNRGLLCGGDFSLPRVSDAWINYQLNNKNYQNIFNRDIQHLDFMQNLEMRNQLVSGAVGLLGDAAKGAGGGAILGGGAGAIAGAVAGTGLSAIGYAIDVDTLAKQHRENRQLAVDKFNYQLGNVKALPYTLTKVGSFDAISKVFPFIEEYVCSEKEMEAFKAKIKYESMTVMRIGTIKEHAEYDTELNYFKGSLIRNDSIADDPHILNAIYEELLKGVYI